MNATTKLAAFGAAVTIIFGGAAAVGAAVGPIDVGGGDHATMDQPSGRGSASIAAARTFSGSRSRCRSPSGVISTAYNSPSVATPYRDAPAGG